MVSEFLPSWMTISLAFAAIMLLYRFGLPLGVSILLSTCSLAILGAGFWHGLQYIGKTVLLSQNLLLLLIIFLLLLFTRALKESNRMDRTVNSLREWIRDHRILLSGLPALVGLLPMPGGALFSAPLVAATDAQNQLKSSHKAIINYWFRHVWEYWWPLYPGVILAIKYSNLAVGTFILIQLPLTVVSVLAGYFFLLKKLKVTPPQKQNNKAFELAPLFSVLGPIGLLVILSIIGSSLFIKMGVATSHANLYSMLGGLTVALGWIFLENRNSLVPSLRMIRDKNTWTLMIVVAAVQCFSAVLQMPLLQSSSTTFVSLMRDEFLQMGIPIVLVIMLVPFISGAVTGIAVGFVGASFPLIYALLGPAPETNTVIAVTSLSYAFGYLGMIVSPVHICYVVTNEYFNTRLTHSYRYLLFPALVLSVFAVVLSGSYYLLIH